MVDYIDTSRKDSVYGQPEVVSAGGGTFLLVANNLGLDNLVEKRVLTADQQKRILSEFGAEEKKPGAVKGGDSRHRLFVLEAKKGDEGELAVARVYSGGYNRGFRSDETSDGSRKYLSPAIHIDSTLNLASPSVPKQAIHPDAIELDSASPDGNLPTEKSAEKFRGNIDEMRNKLAGRDMQRAINQAADAGYIPSEPAGYVSLPTTATNKQRSTGDKSLT